MVAISGSPSSSPSPTGRADARWLTGEQHAWLTPTLAEEEAQRAAAAPAGHRAALRNKKLLARSMVYLLSQCGAYPLTYRTPAVMKDVR